MATKIENCVDATNRLVEVGDRVAAIFQRGDSAPDLNVCEVVGFTEKKIRINYHGQTITKFPHQCVRVDYTKPADLVLILKEQ
jgi:hypothetical protein